MVKGEGTILLTTFGKKPLENTVGKGENAGNQYFLFPTIFSVLSKFPQIYPTNEELCHLSNNEIIVCKML